MKPAYQGKLDGLCGIYAIINALHYACDVSDEETLFRQALESLAHRRWPSILWMGMTIGDLRNIINRVLRQNTEYELKVAYPFFKNPPRTNLGYWAHFDAIFDQPSARCAIIGITKPSLHWIVAWKDGKRIHFADSRPGNGVLRKNRSSLYAGERSKSGKKWLINRRELIVFHA